MVPPARNTITILNGETRGKMAAMIDSGWDDGNKEIELKYTSRDWEIMAGKWTYV
jgi:hypothetical protein